VNSYSYALNNPIRYTDESGEIVPLVIAAGAVLWTGAELALSAYDAYSTYQTLQDTQASFTTKTSSIAIFGLGVVGPGGGYKSAGDGAGNAFRWFKGLDKAHDVAKASEKYSWGNAGTLLRHFRDHGSDFGAKNPADYAKQANNFYGRFGKNGIDVKIDSRGDVLMYESKTNTFGVYTSGGQTKSFYKPDPTKNGGKSGQQYFDDQRGKRLLP